MCLKKVTLFQFILQTLSLLFQWLGNEFTHKCLLFQFQLWRNWAMLASTNIGGKENWDWDFEKFVDIFLYLCWRWRHQITNKNAVMTEETIIFINKAVKTKIIFWEVLVLLGDVFSVVMRKNMWCMFGMFVFRLGH